jgi:hypothetical protein
MIQVRNAESMQLHRKVPEEAFVLVEADIRH